MTRVLTLLVLFILFFLLFDCASVRTAVLPGHSEATLLWTTQPLDIGD